MTRNNLRIRNHGRVIIENATLVYEGQPLAYEDPADYLPRNITMKGVRIA
jgi:hypothetical protein